MISICIRWKIEYRLQNTKFTIPWITNSRICITRLTSLLVSGPAEDASRPGGRGSSPARAGDACKEVPQNPDLVTFDNSCLKQGPGHRLHAVLIVAVFVPKELL